MKVKFLFPLVYIVFIFALIYSCNSTGSNTTYTGNIQGHVYDDSTKRPIYYVNVFANGISDTVHTDTSGLFLIQNIDMPSSDHNYYLITLKAGYNTCTTYVQAKADETVNIDSIKMKRAN